MTLLLFGLAMVVIVGAHLLLQRRLTKITEGILAREEQRRIATDELDKARLATLYKQQKESVRVVARSDLAVRKLADQTRSLHDNGVELHRSVERLLRAAEVEQHG